MSNAVRIVPAAAVRAMEIARLHEALFDPRWSLSSIRFVLEQPASLTFAAETKDACLVGFVLARVAADEAEVLSIGVHSHWQRRGIGRCLLARIVSSAAERGATRLFLEVATDNAPALAFYRAHGLHRVGRRPAYYPRQDRTADALVLARTL
jgi:ribosomal-protein-alanine N-acetyltransferase